MASIHRALALSPLLALLFPATASADVPVVYTRCVRTDAPVDVTMDVTVEGVTRSATRTMTGLDIYDTLPDVTHFLGNFVAPCDLVYRDEAGSERVLYDCSSSSTEEAACAAMDPAVSFDARTIAFTVFRGTLQNIRPTIVPRAIDPRADASGYTYFNTGGHRLKTTEAQLHLVDVATGEVTALPANVLLQAEGFIRPERRGDGPNPQVDAIDSSLRTRWGPKPWPRPWLRPLLLMLPPASATLFPNSDVLDAGAFFRVNSSHDRPAVTGRGGMRHAEVYSREG